MDSVNDGRVLIAPAPCMPLARFPRLSAQKRNVADRSKPGSGLTAALNA